MKKFLKKACVFGMATAVAGSSLTGVIGKAEGTAEPIASPAAEQTANPTAEPATKPVEKQSKFIIQNGVEYTLYNAGEDHDAYAVIESYAGAKNVIDGVFTLPTEMVYNGKTYPIIGSNGYCVMENIHEVIVPEKFGKQQVKISEFIQSHLGSNNFFVVPDVEKITIKADDLCLCNGYADRRNYAEERGRVSRSRIREISINAKEISIGKYAIAEAKNLETLSLSQVGKVTLEPYAIVDCGALKELSLPKDTQFSEGAVSQCKNLEKINFAEGAGYTGTNEVISAEGTLLFVPADVTEYTVPDTVKKEGDLAFSSCNKLQTAECGAETIGEYAFFGCENMNELKLDNTKTIGSYAFVNTGLSSVTIPKSVTDIGDGILYNNQKLKTIKVSGTNYKSKNGALLTASGKTLLAVIPKSGTVNIPKGVTTTCMLPVTAPDKVKEMNFPSTIENIYQMGKKMKGLVKIKFTSNKVPKGVEQEISFHDKIFWNTGDKRAVIYPSASGKLVIDVPDKAKKAYKKFIKQEIECSPTKYKLK